MMMMMVVVMIVWLADCPVCYNLVQEQVNILRRSISELRLIIENIGDDPEEIDDADFRRQLTIVNVTVVQLWEDAKRLSGWYTYILLNNFLNVSVWNSFAVK